MISKLLKKGDMKTIKIGHNDYCCMFDLYKKYMKPFVTASFGWRESFQKEGFYNNLSQSGFRWIIKGADKVGFLYVTISRAEKKIKISLIIIFDEYQRMGLGLSTMNCIIRNSPRQYVIEWGCMKSNHPAQSLYNKIKNTSMHESESYYHYSLIK